jgi:hypothetical protein
MQRPNYDHPRPVELENGMRVGSAAGSTGPGPAAAAALVTAARCRPTARTAADAVNPDEIGHPDFRGNFHKGLHHDTATGLVEPADYAALLKVLATHARNPRDYESLPLALGRPLTNPQAGKAIDAMGPDPKRMRMLPAPTVDSSETAVEAIELYWMALLRDVPFTEWSTNSDVKAAADELTAHEANFYGPTVNTKVTPGTLFRGCAPGDSVGPYVSQFLLRDIPYGSLSISQQQRTAKAAKDYLDDRSAWLDAQNGRTINPDADYDGSRRYIRNLRDLAEYVHVDALYEAYLNACLILLGAGAPLNPGNPYANATKQMGFGTWGGPHILSLVCEMATRALKCVWWQKWYLHRRLRPEAYGGLAEYGFLSAAHPLMTSEAMTRTVARPANTRLLPMAFPEGSPTHPAYGAGHATVAGACVTVLKAFFDENATIDGNVQASPDGMSLLSVGGTLSVGGELNKVAGNIALGRNAGGVHWRSDYTDSLHLGERLAIYILKRQSADYHEDWSMRFTRFDGTQVEITAGEEHEVTASS